MDGTMIGTEDKLVSKAVAGDADALSTVLERCGVQVAAEMQIGSQWQGMVDADDVMQVTYLEAFLRIRQFRGTTTASFIAWLRRISANNLCDAIRELECDKRPRNRVRVSADTDSYTSFFDRLAKTTTTPSRVVAGREIQQAVDEALRKLPTDYETVLRLYALEGRSGPEVAEAMGRKHGAVRMLLARARERLVEVLGSSSRYFSDTA